MVAGGRVWVVAGACGWVRKREGMFSWVRECVYGCGSLQNVQECAGECGSVETFTVKIVNNGKKWSGYSKCHQN